MKAFVGLGSNIGDRHQNLCRALKYLSCGEAQILRSSRVYKTAPIECTGGYFFNAVLEIETSLDALSFLKMLLMIEKKMGRLRKRGVVEVRIIDLDLLFFDDQMIETHDLVLPHPRLHTRRFVLEPLKDLAPGLIHPIFNRTIKELLGALRDKKEVIKATDSVLGPLYAEV